MNPKPLRWFIILAVVVSFGIAALLTTVPFVRVEVSRETRFAWHNDLWYAIRDDASLETVQDVVAREPHLVDVHTSGLFPIHMAAQYDRVDLVEFFLENGTDVNQRSIAKGGTPGPTPIAWAVAQGNIEMAELLIEHGADLNVEGHYKGTLIESARSRRHFEMVELLRRVTEEREPN